MGAAQQAIQLAQAALARQWQGNWRRLKLGAPLVRRQGAVMSRKWRRQKLGACWRVAVSTYPMLCERELMHQLPHAPVIVGALEPWILRSETCVRL